MKPKRAEVLTPCEVKIGVPDEGEVGPVGERHAIEQERAAACLRIPGREASGQRFPAI